MSEEESESFKASRRHITCDAPNCNKKSPEKRCSRCKTVYYCNAACAKANWRAHKPYCRSVEEMQHMRAGLRCEQIPKEEDTTNEVTSECAICFEGFGNVPNVAKLSCGHVFCFKCLTDYQKYSLQPSSYVNQDDGNNEGFPTEEKMLESLERSRQRREGRGLGTTCPMCRTEMPDLRESTMNKISLFLSRMYILAYNFQQSTRKSEVSQETQDELNRLSQRALDEMKPLYDLKEEKLDFQVDLLKCKMLHLKGDNEESLELYLKLVPRAVEAIERLKNLDSMLYQIEFGDLEKEEIDQLYETIHEKLKTGFNMKDADLVELMLDINEVRKALGDWEGAKNDLNTLLIDHPDQDSLPPVEWRKIFMGMSQCQYETGDFEKSIAAGQMSIEMNRHFPGVYTFIGKSYQKLGDSKSADKMFSQAILYETPWDEDNIARAQRQYDDFRREVNLENY